MRGAEAAAELAHEWNDEVRTEELEVTLPSQRTLTIDVADGELRVRRRDQTQDDD
jgi:hypothetical protein